MLAYLLVAQVVNVTVHAAEPARVALDDQGWSLVIDIPNFDWSAPVIRGDGSRAMIRGTSLDTDLLVAVTLAREPELGSAEACKHKYWSRISKRLLDKASVKHRTTPSMAQVHWIVRQFGDVEMKQKNVNAYRYREGFCVEIRLSQFEYRAGDEAQFAEVLAAVRFSDE